MRIPQPDVADHGDVGESGVLLGGEGSPEAAQRLVHRLIIEDVGAVAKGPQVWVRPEDRSDAFVLARLFAEVDRGTSKVAPMPSGAWQGTPLRRLVSAGLLALTLVATLVVVFTAMRLPSG